MVSLGGIARKLFGSANDRRVRSYKSKIAAINALEEATKALSDEALAAKTAEFRQQLADGKTLDDLLIPAFAVAREASRRVLGMRPFDVQLTGGMILHGGAIAEMKTGEGKTLVATLAVYLNALAGKGVHVVTVNDYLAQRDAATMSRLYRFLGLTTGVIVHGLDDDQRREAYACDITYATNNELGFDYLRDNMKYDRAQMVQRGHNYAIVDEVDSILVDEARTPLIISGPLDDRSDLYNTIDAFIPLLTPEDYEIDEKQRSANFSEEGTEKLENLLRQAGLLKGESLYDVENVAIVHHINNALKAHKLFTRDKDYIVRNDEIVIIDEFTGRMMPGRRYSEGQHQALEAKEKVQIQPENQTLSSVTFQNYFRMYEKLAGMTGTAATEAEEFGNIYGLDVIEVPTNLPIQRIDEDDEVYRTGEEKFQAIITEIKAAHERGQPVLVGTTSIEKSELLAHLLRQSGFSDFQVLNARYHEQEAYIVSQAGVPGAVTIATNMAGRGTDIQLGGNVEMRLERELEGMEPGPERDAKEQAIRAEIKVLKEKALAAGGQRLFLEHFDFGANRLFLRIALRTRLHAFQLALETHLDIAAKLDVGTAARHVGGDGDGARHTGLRDDISFLLVVTGVQDLEVGETGLAQEMCQKLGFFNRRRAHQNRLAALMRCLDLGNDRLEFLFAGAINLVVFVDTLDRQVCRHLDDIEAVDVAEFFRFRRCRTRHAGQLFIHAEIILEGDGGQRLVFRLDLHLFLGFESLVLTFGITTARHHATGKFVNDDDFVVADDVVLVAGEELVGLQRIVDVVDDRDVLDVVKRFALEQPRLPQQVFELLGAFFGEVGRALLLIDFVIFRRQERNEGVDGIVEIGTVVQRPGNDERRACLIDQDRVDFVDDCVVVAALNHLGAVIFHVVAQVIEAELVIRRVGDVAGIGLAALVVVKAMNDDAGGEAEEAIEPAHRGGVALGEVVVDGDDVHALAGERVEVHRKSGHQRLAFTRFHLGDGAAVQDHAACQLHVEGTHAENAARCFAGHGKCRDQQVVECLAVCQLLAELGGLGRQRFVGERLGGFFQRIDGCDLAFIRADAAIICRTEQLAGYSAETDHLTGPF